MEGMWRSGEPTFDDDEVVTDGAPRYSRPHHFPPSTDLKGLNSKNTTDSGFLSGVSISNSCSEISSSDLLSEEPAVIKVSSSNIHTNSPGMKLMDSMSRASDSGLDLNYSNDPKINNLSSSQTSIKDSKVSSAAPRKITLKDLLRQDADGDTPLHLAVLQGFIEVVFSLVRILSDPRFLEIPNKKLQSPLHLAVLTNQAPLVRRLVVGGASVLQRDRNGNTPLHLACRDGSLNCVQALLFPVSQEERRAALLAPQIVPQPLPQDLDQWNYDGQMPIHLSVMNGHVNVARLLVRCGANINAKEGKYGRTALHYAVERRQLALLPYLMKEWGALTEIETYSGYTPYQLAIASAPRLAQLLLDLGAHPRPSPLEWTDSSSSSSNESDNGDGEASWRPPHSNIQTETPRLVA